MTRLQEVEKLIDNNLQLITDYTKRAAKTITELKILNGAPQKKIIIMHGMY